MNEDSKKEQETIDQPTVEVEATDAEIEDSSPVSGDTQSEEQPAEADQPQDEEQGAQPTEETAENGEEVSLSEGESDEADAADQTASVDEPTTVEASADAPEATPSLRKLNRLKRLMIIPLELSRKAKLSRER